jgi:hypothetical protein
MRTRNLLAALAACAAASAAAQGSPPQRVQSPPGLSSFGWFADLAGSCWRGEREGRADVQCYSSQFNRFMRGTIKFYQGGKLVGEGDSVFAYDPNEKVIVYSQWGSNGALGMGEVAVEGGDLVFGTRLPDGSEPPTRSVWRRVDADTFHVLRQRRGEQGEGWTEDAPVTYRRVAK